MSRPLSAIAEDFNRIADYLARRDLPALTPQTLTATLGTPQVDLLLLFGGSIPHGCAAAGKAYADGLAKRMMVVGGEGHTTDHLRDEIHRRYPAIKTAGRMEAEVIADYLHVAFDIDPSMLILETKSTNCGENVAFALDTLQRELGGTPDRMLVMQDSSMQRRMGATFHKVWAGQKTQIFHFASYRAHLTVAGNQLVFQREPLWGMWSVQRWIELLLGEIPRLRDDEQGYGPNGKGYIAHVDLPQAVEDSFGRLQREFARSVRKPWIG